MPFKSKAQQRFMFAAEDRGELPKGTAKEWADATEKKKGGIEALPEKVKPSKKTASAIAGAIMVHVPSAASVGSKSKFLRNLGIGAGALGALGLGGYGAYRALRKEEPEEKKASMRKSAVEIAEKVCTPEEKAKCCEGESSKKDEKKSEGNPFAKKDEGNPFEKKEAAACSSSSPKPKKMKKSPKEIANKVWSSKKK